jgi:hypothetical protein
VGKIIEKQNNDLLAAMIICLENQKNEMMLPLKNCLKLMNTIPNSLDDMKKEISMSIKKQGTVIEDEINKLNIISELLESWKQENVNLIKGVDDKVSEVLKIVNEQSESRTKIKSEKEAFGKDFYIEGLIRSNRIRGKAENSSSDGSSSSDSDEDKGSDGDVDGDGYRSYDLVLPNPKEISSVLMTLSLQSQKQKNGVDLERKLRKLKLKFTKFDAPIGNVLEPIFEVLHKTGCVLQPRGLVCFRCGYNIYGREIDDMMGIMRSVVGKQRSLPIGGLK